MVAGRNGKNVDDILHLRLLLLLLFIFFFIPLSDAYSVQGVPHSRRTERLQRMRQFTLWQNIQRSKLFKHGRRLESH